MITLSLDIAPQAKERARVTRQGHAYTPPKTRQFENRVRSMLRGHLPKTGPLKLKIAFLISPPKRRVRDVPSVRPDLDNFVKAFTDACNGILWLDDAQLTEIHATKLYSWADRRVGIELELSEAT